MVLHIKLEVVNNLTTHRRHKTTIKTKYRGTIYIIDSEVYDKPYTFYNYTRVINNKGLSSSTYSLLQDTFLKAFQVYGTRKEIVSARHLYIYILGRLGLKEMCNDRSPEEVVAEILKKTEKI